MLWLMAVIFVVGLPLAAELGGRLHQRLAARAAPDPSGAGLLLAGAIGLLGLLIGFTFAMSAERFETRRELVVAEANALATTYLRDSLFEAPHGARLDALLALYGQSRLAFFAARDNPARLVAAERRTGDLEDAIWKETADALRAPASAPLTIAILTSTNQMFDLAANREAARGARVPTAVIWAVALCAFTTASLCGYGLAAGGHRHRVASILLFVLIAAALVLISDLDSPRRSLIQVPRDPLVRAVAQIQDHETRRATWAP